MLDLQLVGDGYERLGASAGYEIGRSGRVIILAHRNTRPPALVAWIAGGSTLLAVGHAILWPFLGLTGRVATRPALIAGLVLVPVALLLGWVARAGYRRYRRRRDASIDEVPAFRAQLDQDRLSWQGQEVARLDEIRIDTPRNMGDSTQGRMKWVRLRWPGGAARVYSAAARNAEDMADVLVQLGVGHRAR
jgi:hypothetical protein